MFSEHQNKKEFMEVMSIIDLIGKAHHTESDEERIMNYLKKLPALSGRFDHLNKALRKRVI